MGFTRFVRTGPEQHTVLWVWRTCRRKIWLWMALITSLSTEMN